MNKEEIRTRNGKKQVMLWIDREGERVAFYLSPVEIETDILIYVDASLVEWDCFKKPWITFPKMGIDIEIKDDFYKLVPGTFTAYYYVHSAPGWTEEFKIINPQDGSSIIRLNRFNFIAKSMEKLEIEFYVPTGGYGTPFICQKTQYPDGIMRERIVRVPAQQQFSFKLDQDIQSK